MKPRQRAIKPLLGFGPAGYVLLIIFLALLIPTVVGVDLQYQFHKLTAYLFGNDAIFWLAVAARRVWIPMVQAKVSLLTAAAGLIAFHIAPYRIKPSTHIIWFVTCSFWSLAAHILYDPSLHQFSRMYVNSTKHLMTFGWLMAAPGMLTMVICTAYAARISRSKIVTTSWSAALLLMIVWNIIRMTPMQYLSAFTLFRHTFFQYEHFRITPLWLLFFILTSSSLLIWAIIERRKPVPESLCRSCLYDLAGLPKNSPCPECGNTPTDTEPSGAVVNTGCHWRLVRQWSAR